MKLKNEFFFPTRRVSFDKILDFDILKIQFEKVHSRRLI